MENRRFPLCGIGSALMLPSVLFSSFAGATRKMRIGKLALTLATLTVGLSCSSVTEPSRDDPLLGRWSTDRSALNPAGSMQSHLTFSKDGSFVAEHRSYGVYPSQRAEDLSAYWRTSGTYVLEADRLNFLPKSLASWDRFYGPHSAELVETPYPYGTLYDDARFKLQDSVLTLRYLTYPADAPVPTLQTFRLDR